MYLSRGGLQRKGRGRVRVRRRYTDTVVWIAIRTVKKRGNETGYVMM